MFTIVLKMYNVWKIAFDFTEYIFISDNSLFVQAIFRGSVFLLMFVFLLTNKNVKMYNFNFFFF